MTAHGEWHLLIVTEHIELVVHRYYLSHVMGIQLNYGNCGEK